MKSFIILSCVLAVALSEDTYPTTYDNTDCKEMVKNERLVEGHSKCFLDLGPCTPEGKEFKSHIADALENNCAKCSDKQKDGIKDCLGIVIKKYPDIWNKLCEKYDPESKYRKKYEDQAKELGIEHLK